MTGDIPILSSRRIVVTGAGRGLGRALAIRAADLGANLVLVGRDQAALYAVAAIITQRTGRGAQCVACDLSRPDSVKAACETVLSSDQVVDVLINNGAPWLAGDIADLADIDVVDTIAAAVAGTILVTKGLLPGLRRSAAADIVTIVSTAGLVGWEGSDASVVFYAAKHGQSGFSDRLRHELRREAIRVMAIYPPNFDDEDPLDSDWSKPLILPGNSQLGARGVVETIFFAITAPRNCAFPMIVLDGMSAE